MVSAEQDVLWRSRWLIAGSCLVVAAAVGLLVATQAHRFVWGLFAWGLLVCLAGALVVEVAARLGLRRNGATGLAETWQRRRPIYDGLWAFWGVGIGVLAASFDLVLIDVAATAYIVVAFGVAGALVANVLRRRRVAAQG